MKPYQIAALISLTAVAALGMAAAPAVADGWATAPGVSWDKASATLSIPQHMTGPQLQTTESLDLQSGKPWSVSFDVKLGECAGSMSVALLQGQVCIARMGADSYYKAESAFIGDAMPNTRPVDEVWHSYRYQSDGQNIALYCDGIKVDQLPSSAAPDTLRVQSYQMETTIRNVNITTNVEAAQSSSVGALNAPVQPARSDAQRKDHVLFTYPDAPTPPTPVVVPYYVPYYVPYIPEPSYRTFTETNIYTEIDSW